MPTSPDVLTGDLRTVAEGIGGFLALVALAFTAVYNKARTAERERADRTPEIAALGATAAIIDRSATDAAAKMAEDMRAMRGDVQHVREIADRWEERTIEDERDELKELRRRVREQPAKPP